MSPLHVWHLLWLSGLSVQVQRLPVLVNCDQHFYILIFSYSCPCRHFMLLPQLTDVVSEFRQVFFASIAFTSLCWANMPILTVGATSCSNIFLHLFVFFVCKEWSMTKLVNRFALSLQNIGLFSSWEPLVLEVSTHGCRFGAIYKFVLAKQSFADLLRCHDV